MAFGMTLRCGMKLDLALDMLSSLVINFGDLLGIRMLSMTIIKSKNFSAMAAFYPPAEETYWANKD
jgi:hypothetical protein